MGNIGCCNKSVSSFSIKILKVRQLFCVYFLTSISTFFNGVNSKQAYSDTQ